MVRLVENSFIISRLALALRVMVCVSCQIISGVDHEPIAPKYLKKLQLSFVYIMPCFYYFAFAVYSICALH